jgi:SAM-dependent methyltransferase
VGDETTPTYTFGDSDVAGDRLSLLAAVFEPTTAALLREVSPTPRLALDLGCGPGFTTRLVASTTQAERTVGLDASPAFVARAALRAPRGVAFVRHDVTRPPLPVDLPDVVFARYLLAHLPNPLVLADRWGAELARGGHLLLEEVETIETDLAVFADYLAIVTGMIASRGGRLDVGRDLAHAQLPSVGVTLSRAVPIAPSTAVVARIFSMNLATWQHDPWVRSHVRATDLDRIAGELGSRLDDDSDGHITWTHRQVVYARS